MRRSYALRNFARGQSCTLCIDGVCNHDDTTVILAHGHGAGMGTKLVDYIGVHACSACHDWLDREATQDEYHAAFAPALLETLQRVARAGLMRGNR